MPDLTRTIIGDAIAIHRELGPGLLESAYAGCLAHLLARRGLHVERQVTLPLTFRGELIESAYRLDMRVEEEVVVELKAIQSIAPVHVAQMLTYLKLSGCTVGLIINFNVPKLVDGVRRVVLGHTDA